MTNSEISAFLAIVECGSFSKAAEMLFITQPALSRRIQSLENEIGYKLFERNKGFRNAVITEQGKAFISIADKMQELLNETEKIKTLDKAESLRITCVGSVNSVIMPPVYKRFIEKKGGIHLSISAQHSDRGYEFVSKDMTDIGFIATDMYFKNVETRPFYKEKMVLVTDRNTKIKDAHPSCLDPRKEILYMWSSEYTMWHSYWFEATAEPIARIDGVMVLDSLIAAEGAWAVVPLSVAERIRRTSPVSIYEMSDGPSDRIVYYIVRPGKRNSLADEFLDTAKEVISQKPYITLLS
ncbi:MAG: LysR family transcriptional regulator [Clostridia bacterium]|nr:LysR family transcriptional regulator [Clostridia bacterium]